MVSKYGLDNSGKTWKCRSCQSLFFIPNCVLLSQKKVGCPVCQKKLWSSVGYMSLFIKDTLKRATTNEDYSLNDNLFRRVSK